MKRVSKSLYIWTPIVVLAAVLVVASGASVQRGEVPPIMFLVMVPYLAVMSTLVYKAWGAIQDGHARTSPGRAVGVLVHSHVQRVLDVPSYLGPCAGLQPFFREPHSMMGPKLPEWLFLGYTILMLATPWVPIPTPLPLILVVWFFSVISSTCDAVNAVPSTFARSVAPATGGEIQAAPQPQL